MKAFLKTILVFAVGSFAVVLINLVFFRPFSINMFYAKSFAQFAMVKPQMLSTLHILEQYGFKFHQSKLDDMSEKAQDEATAKLSQMLSDLKGYDRSQFTADERNNYETFETFVKDALEGAERWRYHNYPVNQLAGIQSEFPSFMDASHQVQTLGDAEDYVTRLSQVKVQFTQVLEGLKLREEKGIIPPRFVIKRVLDEMNGFTSTTPEHNILYQSLERKMKDAKLKDEDQQKILAAAKNEIVHTVYPAYHLFLEHFEALLTKANDDDGVWKLPNGDAFYSYALRTQTTTNFTPEQIHKIGLDDVARIEEQMKQIFDKEGIAAHTVGEAMIKMGNDPKYLFSDNDEGRAQILAGYSEILKESDRRMDQYFDQKPKAKIEVKRVPLFKEKTAPGGYYDQAAMDGSKPGTFYTSLYDIKATPKYGMRTLAYHEGIPGHHFQISLAQENDNLAFFRKVLGFTAYVEGWALYSEQLAWEAGLEPDPIDNIGRLQSELFRSVRLVVDTGIHKKHWTRQQAINYMSEHTGMTESDVTVEIERYIVDPGQACAYKMGMLKILELRKRSQDALGEGFNIKEFHHVILGGGALPLAILERNIDEWIASKKGHA